MEGWLSKAGRLPTVWMTAEWRAGKSTRPAFAGERSDSFETAQTTQWRLPGLCAILIDSSVNECAAGLCQCLQIETALAVPVAHENTVSCTASSCTARSICVSAGQNF